MLAQIQIKRRSILIDCLRGLGILLIIWGHCSNYFHLNLIYAMYLFHVPLFFWISGMLTNADVDIPLFIKKK